MAASLPSSAIGFAQTELHKTSELGRSDADANYSNSATTIGVNDATNPVAWPSGNFTLFNEDTGELIFCSSRSGNTLTVVRGFGGTSAAPITAGDTLNVVLASSAIQAGFEEIEAIDKALLGQLQGEYVFQGATTDNTEKVLELQDSAGASVVEFFNDKAVTFGGSVTITGDLVVNGDTVEQNVATMEVEDNIIVLNDGEGGSGVTEGTSGIEIDRGSLDNAQLVFDESNDRFRVSTDAGATLENLALASEIESVAGSDGQIQYNNGGSFGGAANLTYDDGTGRVTHGAATTLTGDVTLQQASQDVLLQGRSQHLSLSSQSTGAAFQFQLETADKDGTDFVGYQVFATGNFGATDQERFDFLYDPNGPNYIIQTSAAGTGTHHPIKLQSGSNTDQLVLATDGTVLFGTSTSQPEDVVIDGTGSAGLGLNGTNLGDNSDLVFREAGNLRYQFGYDTGNTRFKIATGDSDGGGTTADVIRIPDGQLTVDGNATFDDNAFDYVCQNRDCGWSAGVWTEDNPCPRCGGAVEWHDDLALLTEVVTGGQNILETSDDAMERMEAIGVLKRDGDEMFIGFQKAHLFSFSAISQAHRRIQALEKACRESGISVPEVNA